MHFWKVCTNESEGNVSHLGVSRLIHFNKNSVASKYNWKSKTKSGHINNKTYKELIIGQ